MRARYGGRRIEMATILTNEWTSVGEAYPPAGRVVLCIVERMLEGGRFSRRHDTAIWNGVEWLDERTKTRKELAFGESITDWYMFDRYRPWDYA